MRDINPVILRTLQEAWTSLERRADEASASVIDTCTLEDNQSVDLHHLLHDQAGRNINTERMKKKKKRKKKQHRENQDHVNPVAQDRNNQEEDLETKSRAAPMCGNDLSDHNTIKDGGGGGSGCRDCLSLTQALFMRHPLFESMDLTLNNVLLQDLDGLSMSQLELLQEAHLQAYHVLNEKKVLLRIG